MQRPIRYINESEAEAFRQIEGFVPVEYYAHLVPEPQEIGSITKDGVCVERIFVRRLRSMYPGEGAPSDYFNGA